MGFNFSNKVILVTGGTGALGRIVSRSFLNQSPKAMVVTYRTGKESLKRSTELINVSGQSTVIPTSIEFVKTDITKEEEIKNLISIIIESHGRIDILVNVVGGYIGGKSVIELEESDWDKMIDINLKSAFLISKHVIPLMISNHYGKIVHISSLAGAKADGNDSAYAASKAGLIRFVESASKEVRKSNININCILPSIIDTEANRTAIPTADFSKWINPEDLANVIMFLCSDDSKIINGSAIPIY